MHSRLQNCSRSTQICKCVSISESITCECPEPAPARLPQKRVQHDKGVLQKVLVLDGVLFRGLICVSSACKDLRKYPCLHQINVEARLNGLWSLSSLHVRSHLPGTNQMHAVFLESGLACTKCAIFVRKGQKPQPHPRLRGGRVPKPTDTAGPQVPPLAMATLAVAAYCSGGASEARTSDTGPVQAICRGESTRSLLLAAARALLLALARDNFPLRTVFLLRGARCLSFGDC
jgi:hypothetical protein